MVYLKWVLIVILVFLAIEVVILVADHIIFEKSKRSKLTQLEVREDFELQVHEFEKINNPLLIKQIKQEAEIALLLFPELQHEKISISIKPASFPMASRPDLLPLLFPWLDRRYSIVISNNTPEALRPILYYNLPYQARIGVLGHELAHTLYYHERSNLQIIYTGLLYLNKNFRKRFEKATDIETIKRGLGRELYQWSIYLKEIKKQHPDIENINFIFEDRYLAPEEIKNYTIIKENIEKN